MREILFRGKCKYNGEWVEGYLVKLGKESFSDLERYGICNKAIPLFGSGVSYNLKIDEVIQETIGQYTGSTDKNSKKIFEGDIVSIPFEEDRYPYGENVIHYENAEVYFDTERYSWYVKYSDDDLVSLWEYDDRDVIVIGNIHENSELLKSSER